MFRSIHLGKPPICLVACFILINAGCRPQVDSNKLLQQVKQNAARHDWSAAEEIASKIPRESKEWLSASMVLAEAISKQGELRKALSTYQTLLVAAPAEADLELIKFSAAEIHLQLGELRSARKLYAELLQSHPKDGITNQRMAFLLSLTGQRWDALDHYFVLIQRGDATYQELALAADVGRQIEQGEFLEKCLAQSPNDPLVQQAIATQAFHEGEDSARELLEKLVASHPELLVSQAMLGEMLVESPDFVAWHNRLPATADQAPDIWYVRGLWARQQGELDVAAECFWQAVTRMPFYRRAFYMLGQTLVALDDSEAERVSEYSEKLIELSQTIDHVLRTKAHSEPAFRRATELLEELGRIWEACAWGVVARRRFPEARWPDELFARQSHKLRAGLPRIETSSDPTAQRESHDVPAFAKLLQSYRPEDAPTMAAVDGEACTIRFQSVDLIDFTYHNADDPTTKGKRTFEQTGGGVAVLDYDKDGVPDLFLTQGTEWEPGSDEPTPSGKLNDSLYRNLDGAAFVDVSPSLGVDSGYGQGCAGGDFNNDGFPDLYVANVGRNALYENMGDGTFLQVTEEAVLTDNAWTASVMICDLNADGLPDLFDVNYLQGEGVYQKICQGYACSPSVFPGAPDRVLINLGDGRFEQIDDLTPEQDSKGLGVVAFELEPNRRPTLFIANDQVANFFLSNEPTDNKHNIQLNDSALAAGMAYNENGLAMACMGIAVADWDANGLTDVFVTNFLDEANTLYLQDSPSLFVDATRTFGLQAASIPYTGWGTQSLDADLDGWPDVVITNGHVDDYREEGGPYRMPPQFFRNLGGSFEECSPQDLGPWFQQEYLGRGLARLDWNMDGRPEFAVSNVNQPSSLLLNTTETTGRFVVVKLSAWGSSREATGARVSVRTQDREFQQQVVAGDGYMASNEKTLHFGIGSAERIERIEVQWPSGEVSELRDVPSDSHLVILERLSTATVSTSSGSSSLPVAVR